MSRLSCHLIRESGVIQPKLEVKKNSRVCDDLLQFGYRSPYLLALLNEHRETLVVLNHALWDEAGIGRDEHLQAVQSLLSEHGWWIHADDGESLEIEETGTRLAISHKIHRFVTEMK